MQNRSTEELSQLVRCLSKAQKRQFTKENRSTKTAGLFEAINTGKSFDDPQVHNLRANLYRQLLGVMRHQPAAPNPIQTLHEGISDANMLYQKQLYAQSYKQLQKTKPLAVYYQQVAIRFQLVALEKKIAAVAPVSIDMGMLQKESKAIAAELGAINHWSIVSLLLTGWHQRHGHVSNERERREVDGLLDHSLEPIGFYAIHYAWKAKVYHAYIQNDSTYLLQQQNWTAHFDHHPQMKIVEAPEYEKAKEFGCVPVPETLPCYKDNADITRQYYQYAKQLCDRGQFAEALDYTSPIVNGKGFYRTDLQILAREMEILCHQRLGNEQLIPYLRKSLKRFADKNTVFDKLNTVFDK